MRFRDKVAIVTGSAGGIGLAIAKRLGAEGARLLIADIDATKCDQAAQAVKDAGAPDAFGHACDVADEAQVEATVAEAVRRFGRIDIVVNNAGVMTFKPLQELTRTDWTRVLDVDLLGAAHFTKAAFKRMQTGGAIVNISSIHAIMTSPTVAPYAAAKAALLSLTHTAAIEGKPKGIRVNAILPGAIDTPMLWNNPNVKSGVEKIDKSDVGKPEDIGAAVAYLASDDASFVQGVALPVDGGRLIRLG